MCSLENVLAVDIGGTSIKLGVVNNDKVLESTSIRNTFKGKSSALIEGIKEICHEYINKYNVRKIGIGCPGDIADGVVVVASNLGWTNYNLLDDFKKEFVGLEIQVENDGIAACKAEMKLGNLKNVETGLFVTIGRGIGGGIIINQKLVQGSHKLGGKIGHVTLYNNGRKCNCGRRGCYETYCSVLGLIRTVKEENVKFPENEKINVERLSGFQIVSLKKENNSVALKGLKRWNGDFASGLVNLCNLFDPSVIVIAGGITEGDLLDLDYIKEELNKNGFSECEVLLAKFKGKTGLIGAASLLN